MTSKLASEKALAVIDHYLHFRYGCDGRYGEMPTRCGTISIPYFNNNHKIVRAGLRGEIGKGSPQDIFDEVEIAAARDTNISTATMAGTAFTSVTLKHFLVDHDIGIDCSGFVYYVLNAEFSARDKGSLDRHLKFPLSKGLFGTIRSKMRPAENADVATFAHDRNSRVVTLEKVEPGDIITMIDENSEKDEKSESRKSGRRAEKNRDHILFIHQVDYRNSTPTTLYYSHSMAWPSDGTYGHGVRQGKIEIIDPSKSLVEQKWTEAEKIATGGSTSNMARGAATSENYTFSHAIKARTEIRRMLSL